MSQKRNKQFISGLVTGFIIATIQQVCRDNNEYTSKVTGKLSDITVGTRVRISDATTSDVFYLTLNRNIRQPLQDLSPLAPVFVCEEDRDCYLTVKEVLNFNVEILY